MFHISGIGNLRLQEETLSPGFCLPIVFQLIPSKMVVGKWNGRCLTLQEKVIETNRVYGVFRTNCFQGLTYLFETPKTPHHVRGKREDGDFPHDPRFLRIFLILRNVVPVLT